ncbi:FYVE, RhoGEF and PH domain-containing protein 6-like isoform X2 [Acanthochromis polyacanthus]|uniref:FYVE, RhoGEF and PH domain-containing protein 6-like isoform X2 n=1 Tax=Acanthochromis polyacanthus TaxID=80966 RepID=UPI0022343DBA|nr:FYVE, RhoGEF and PH domain-containing protein 6-like isoform X2 [Acanthochromis polyacanthus]
MMNSGMPKPPVAPKPKLSLHQRPGLSPSIPRKEGISLLSPGTPRKAKPVLAPKPCLSKLTTAVESKPLISRSLHQTLVSETPRTIGLLNSQNGIQQENKKPDWDYIIPICLCNQENCMCIRNTSTDRTEKNLKTLQKGKTQENQKTVVTARGSLDGSREKTDDAKCQVTNTSSINTHLISHKPLQDALTVDRNIIRCTDTPSPEVTVRPSLINRTWSDEENAYAIPQSAPGRGPEEDALGSEQTSALQPKPVPVAPRKPIPVPVPRKPRTVVQTNQEKVEEGREDNVSEERREVNVKEVKVPSEGKGSSSLSVSVADSENNPPMFLSARRVCAPPAPPPRKKPFLSAPEKAPTSAPLTLPKDVKEEDLGWDSSNNEMEVSVDDEDEEMQKEGADDQEAADGHRTHRPPSSSLLSQLKLSQSPGITAGAEKGMVKVVPNKPQRHSSSMALIQKKELPEEREVGKVGDAEKQQASPLQDSVLEERMPSPTKEKSSKNLLMTGIIKPSRSSLSKQKAKSFSAADIIRSDGQRRTSFRKLLDLKLSVMMLPKLKVKGGQIPEPSIDKDQDKCQNLPEPLNTGQKFSCPLIGVEQNVDGDEFSPELEQDPYYENIAHYEEIPDYINVPVGEAGSSPRASFSQSAAWQSSLYNDEDIYEEQEPYISLVKHEQYDSSVDEEVAVVSDAPWDDDNVVNSSDEDEDDSSSISSKGDPEQPEESPAPTEKKKSKIHHIATEIMTSESVFVDVLKMLHVDFRDSVSKASQESGKPVIEERLLNQILYYLPQLYELNHDLLRELRQRVANWDENAQVADIFLKKGPYLKMYSTYIREYDKNVALLEEQMKKNAAFGAVVRNFEATPRCANLALKHYLLKPVQRIPQYQLLLTDYLKNLSEDSDDYKDTQAALAIVKEVANHANDIMKQGDIFQKLIQVQCRLNGHHEIVTPGRVFLKEGILMKLSRKVMQPRMFFLFNDILLYTTPVQSGQFKLNNMLSLAGMKVSKPSQEACQNELKIESVERSFILSASSATERDEWLEAISTAISDYTRKKISFISGKPPDQVDLSDHNHGAPLGSKAPIWIPDPRTTMCMICTCEFTLTWRRHHCRACGKVVCQSCSSNKHCLEYLKNQPARVCDQCFLVLQEQKSERALSAAVSPGNKAAFTFARKHKKIPAALKEVSANTDNSSMSGYLQRSKRTKKGKRLWFVIQDKVLYTYAASEDVAALESQPLLGFVLKVDSSQKLQFKLYHKNTLYYNFKADDAQTAQRWIESFKEATVL